MTSTPGGPASAAAPAPTRRTVLAATLAGAVLGASALTTAPTARAATAAPMPPGPVAAGLVAPAAVATGPTTARLSLGPGGVLQRTGRPFRAAGVNVFSLVTNDYPSPRLMAPAEVDEVLDRAVALGAGIVRSHTLGVSIGNQPWHLVAGVNADGTLVYREEVRDRIDHAVAAAKARGLYLEVLLFDEHGYYHGGKRDWVELYHPGTTSKDWRVTTGGSKAERDAETPFYTDRRVVEASLRYVHDFFRHVNPYTGVRNGDEPTIALVGANELWTSAQEGLPAGSPGSYDRGAWTFTDLGSCWMDAFARAALGYAPGVLVVDAASADGAPLSPAHLALGTVHVHGTHPYTAFGVGSVRRMARQAAASGKAFAVDEYAWTKANAPMIEAVARSSPNVAFTAPWSLQNDRDLHSGGPGAGFGGDDAPLYVPASDPREQAALARLRRHAAAMARR